MGPVRTLLLGLVAWGALATRSNAASITASPLAWTSWKTGAGDLGSIETTFLTALTTSQTAYPVNYTYGTSGTSASDTSTVQPTASSNQTSVPSPPATTISSSAAAPAAVTTSGTYDGYINFSGGPFPSSDSLTTGAAQAWSSSPAVQHVFGGTPTSQQQMDFEKQVLADVQKTFSLAGLSPNLTIDPSAHANHTLSIVSHTAYSANPNAIGITNVGSDGFSFIDKLSYANSVTDLEWAVAHNVAHELMHAFGVATHHDTTGTFLDAASASWSLLTDPNTTFSKDAAQDILSRGYARSNLTGLGPELLSHNHAPGHSVLCQCPLCRRGYVIVGAEGLTAQPVPEPATIALWGLAGAGIFWHCKRNRSRAAA